MNETSEQRAIMTRVERVKHARRHAARLRERTLSIPPIVVIKPSGDDLGHDTRQELPRNVNSSRPKSLPDLARSRAFEALLNNGDAYLHPHSAVERCARTSGCYYGASEHHSCPVSPVSCNPRSANTSPLRLDTRYGSIDYRYMEIAMEVVEEAARICDSPGPLPTDVPLVFSGINARTIDEFKIWLMARYDYRGHAGKLMDEAVTPEILALDILKHLSESDVSPLLSGIIPIALADSCKASSVHKTPSVHVPAGSSQLTSTEACRAQSPISLSDVSPRRHRLRTKKDLTIELAQSPANATHILPSPALPSTPVPGRTQPVSARSRDAGPTEPRSGKKAGFVVGLLAMGALLSRSPSTPSTFDHRTAGTPPSTPAPFASASASFMDLPRTPHSASGFAGWYGAQRESPHGEVRFLSPPELLSITDEGADYCWFALSPSGER